MNTQERNINNLFASYKHLIKLITVFRHEHGIVENNPGIFRKTSMCCFSFIRVFFIFDVFIFSFIIYYFPSLSGCLFDG